LRRWRWLSSGLLPWCGYSKHIWNIGKLLPDYTAQLPIRQSVIFILAAVSTWNLTCYDAPHYTIFSGILLFLLLRLIYYPQRPVSKHSESSFSLRVQGKV
jgi:hypothetical protein